MSTEQYIHSDTKQYGTFRLGGQVFGVELLRMREIIRVTEITRIPRAEDCVEGVINLRGSVIPIVNLRRRFDMPHKAFDKETRIINIEINNLVIGFVVDAIGQVYRLPGGALEPPPAVAASVDSQYIAGVANCGEEILVVLDVDRLLSAETLFSLAQV